MEPKSLLLVGNHLSLSKKNISVGEELAKRLLESGWSVLMVSRQANRMARLADMIWTIWHRKEEYSVAQADVFSGPAFLWAEMSVRLLSKLGKPIILTLHGGNLPSFARQQPHRVRRTLALASEVTAPSHYLQETMQEFRSDIQLIPNPLEIANYPFQLRENIKPLLIWLRAFHRIYNPELAPRVLACLVDEFPHAKLIMVGPDKGDGSLQATQKVAAELGVFDNIEFTGPVGKSEVPSFINRGDIFLNTTNVDNTPVSVMETMACGLCIVSTNVGGIPYLLDHEKDSLLVPPEDPEAMAKAIRRILTEPGLAQKLSNNARKKAEGFDWSMVLPQWEKLFGSHIR